MDAMALPVASFGGFGRTPFSKGYNSAPPPQQRHLAASMIREKIPVQKNPHQLYPPPCSQNVATRDFKRMLEGMRGGAAPPSSSSLPLPSPYAAYHSTTQAPPHHHHHHYYQQQYEEYEVDQHHHHHAATLKRKLLIRGKQLKAAKRKISAVSKEKAGLVQQLALREQKLKVVMAAKDIYLNLSVDKTLYHDVMSTSSSSSSSDCKKRPRRMDRQQHHPAVAFVDRVKRHLGERQDVVVKSSWEQEGGSSRRLAFHVDFWRTPGPIVVRDEVFQPEPMGDFLSGLACDHGPEAVVVMLREAIMVDDHHHHEDDDEDDSDGGGASDDEESGDEEGGCGSNKSSSMSRSSSSSSFEEEDDYYSDDVEVGEDGQGCRVLSRGKFGLALESLLASQQISIFC